MEPFKLALGTLLAAICLASITGMAMSHDNALTAWANDAYARAEPAKLTAVSTKIDDHFGRDIISGGEEAYTPCSGTLWVYDYHNHIAAGRDRGDTYDGVIFYSGLPPTRLPDKDLSAITSVRGLHLGDSPAHVAKVFNVPMSAIVQLPNHHRALYVIKKTKCQKYTCAHDAVIIFERDHAVSISLHAHGP